MDQLRMGVLALLLLAKRLSIHPYCSYFVFTPIQRRNYGREDYNSTYVQQLWTRNTICEMSEIRSKEVKRTEVKRTELNWTEMNWTELNWTVKQHEAWKYIDMRDARILNKTIHKRYAARNDAIIHDVWHKKHEEFAQISESDNQFESANASLVPRPHPAFFQRIHEKSGRAGNLKSRALHTG